MDDGPEFPRGGWQGPNEAVVKVDEICKEVVTDKRFPRCENGFYHMA